MVYVKAGPAEILRSSQKDEFVVNKLQKLCEEVVLRLAGPRQLILHKNIIEKFGEILYYGATTLCGLQTLGEEYTGILQVDRSFQSIPSITSRVTMVVFHCFGRRIAEQFLITLEKNIQGSDEMRPDAKVQLLKWVSLLKALLPTFESLHKGIFYCSWSTYHLSKRLTGIHYVLIRYWLRDRKSLFGFRVLGVITLINFVFCVLETLHKFWRRELSPTTGVNELEMVTTYGIASTKKCTMCLNNLQNPTATMCGHIFCWSCINEWLQNQDRCPICRDIVPNNRVIPLMNYV